MFLKVLTNGEIPQIGIDVFNGLLVILGIVMIILVFIITLKQMIKAKEIDVKSKVDIAVNEKTKEIEIDSSLRDVKMSMDRVNDSLSILSRDISVKLEKLETQIDRQGKQIIKIDASVHSAHRRVDEHRRLEHCLTAGYRLDSKSIEEEEEDDNKGD